MLEFLLVTTACVIALVLGAALVIASIVELTHDKEAP